MAKPPGATDDDYARIPEDEWVKVEIIEAEIGESPWKDEKTGKKQIQVKIVLEAISDDEDVNGARAWVFTKFSLRGDKSKLRKIALAVVGEDGLEDFDTDDLVGKKLLVKGDYGDDGDSDYIKISKFRAVGSEDKPRGRRKPQPEPDDDDDAEEVEAPKVSRRRKPAAKTAAEEAEEDLDDI